MNQQESNLIRSLESINRFIDGKDIIADGKDFVDLYSAVQKELLTVGEQRKTNFYANRIAKLPSIHKDEIDEFLRRRNKQKTIFFAMGGFLLYYIVELYMAIKTKGRSASNMKPKLDTIKRLNIGFITALEKPGIEELLNEADDK